MYKPRITRVTCPAGDWTGLYINGELVEEGHAIPDWMLLDILQKYEVLTHHCMSLTDDQMEEGLPMHLEELR